MTSKTEPKGFKDSMKGLFKKDNLLPDNKEDIGEAMLESEEPIKRTFDFPKNLLVKLEQEAYWERKTQREILMEMLQARYQEKHYDPIPATYKKPQRGRKKTS